MKVFNISQKQTKVKHSHHFDLHRKICSKKCISKLRMSRKCNRYETNKMSPIVSFPCDFFLSFVRRCCCCYLWCECTLNMERCKKKEKNISHWFWMLSSTVLLNNQALEKKQTVSSQHFVCLCSICVASFTRICCDSYVVCVCIGCFAERKRLTGIEHYILSLSEITTAKEHIFMLNSYFGEITE